MSVQNAVAFVQFALNNAQAQEKLKALNIADKKASILTLVAVGREHGFDFSGEEYEQAAVELYNLYNVDKNGIEELKTMSVDSAANCTCSGCAACAACTACLVCISCAWCIVIPFGGEAVIAADAAGAISAAAALSTGVSTGVATAAQGN